MYVCIAVTLIFMYTENTSSFNYFNHSVIFWVVVLLFSHEMHNGHGYFLSKVKDELLCQGITCIMYQCWVKEIN